MREFLVALNAGFTSIIEKGLGGGGGEAVSAVDCKFSHWVTCISQRRETTAVFTAYDRN